MRILRIALPPGGATAWEQRPQRAWTSSASAPGLLMQTADNREMTRWPS